MLSVVTQRMGYVLKLGLCLKVIFPVAQMVKNLPAVQET